MSYVDSTLLPGEKVILKAQIHWIVFAPAVVLWAAFLMLYTYSGQGLVGVVLVVTALASTAKALMYYYATELAVTDRRVIAKFGFIKRDTYELNVNRVTSLNVDQSVLGRILNYGDVTVVGMGGSAAPILAIVDPLKFRRYMLTEVEGTKLL
ncbi:MAG: PH domain-containing protein [Gammaproteobacteria bacterium]